MKKDVLQEYISLQSTLHREREELVARLRQIDEVLGQTFSSSGNSDGTPRARRGRKGNPLSLRDAVLQVTAKRPMTKEEVYQAVQRIGYRFGGKDPLNSLGVVLYGKNPRFRNEGGRFSPISLPAMAGQRAAGTGKRFISAEARERIAAAQRARWARQKGLTDNKDGGTATRRRMSAQGRARIAAAARARWAQVRSEAKAS